MISNLIKKVKAFVTAHNRELFLVILVVLLGSLSFGLGRLSILWKEKEPITVEKQQTNIAPPGEVAGAVIVAPASASKSPPPTVIRVVAPPPSPNGKFVASKKGTAYHFPWCPGAKQIKEENKIWFQTKEEAVKAGYKPAANCPGL